MMFKKKNVFIGIIAFLFSFSLFKKISLISLKLEYICTLYIKDKSISFKGYLDTGNMVKDVNGRGVIILSEDIINNLLDTNINFNTEDYNDYLYIYSNLPEYIKNSFSYTFYNDVKEKKILPLLKFDKIIIANKNKKITIYSPNIGVLKGHSFLALIPISVFKNSGGFHV